MNLLEHYRSPKDLPGSIPVFPLRSAILLPRATLPLNIFEPRYAAMFDDAISGARLIGIVQPVRDAQLDDEEADTDEPESNDVPLRSIGCVGRVTAFQELGDGRLLATLTGICRFVIRAESPSKFDYRICDIDCGRFVSDLIEGEGEDDVDRDKLLQVLKAYLVARNLDADWRAIKKSTSEFLVNSLSVISPYGPEEKQALLETETLAARAEVLIALAEMELASGESGSGPGGTTLQ